MDGYTNSEYSDKCRVCLQCRELMHSLFRERDSCGAPAVTLTRSCAMRISPGDGGPALICSQCLQELEVTRDFLSKCESAERTLASVLNIKKEPHWSKDDTVENAHDRSDGESEKVQDTVIDVAVKKEKKVRKKVKSKKLGNEPEKIATETGLTCDTCGRAFAHAGNLRTHQRLHTGEKPFACDMCEKSFSKKDNLMVHRKRHLNKRSFSCETCGASHYTAYELRVHARTHTGDKPHACAVCGRRFTASNNLYIHQRTHTGERPHQCNVCGKKFRSNNVLSIHKRTHTGEKPYVCPVCGKRFTSNKLAAHARTHTGEKQHVCTLCGRQFASPNVLKIHMRRHTGEKPYRCSVCGQHYAHTQSLNKHRRRRHAPGTPRPPFYTQENNKVDGEQLSEKQNHFKYEDATRNALANGSECEEVQSSLNLVPTNNNQHLDNIT